MKAVSRPLRFGVICEGTTLTAWETRCIEELSKVPDVHLALRIISEKAKGQRFSESNGSRTRYVLFQAYLKMVRSKAMRPVDMVGQLSDIPAITCRMMTNEDSSQQFDEPDIRRIREHDLDFILHLGFDAVSGDILRAARYGVWSFRCGNIGPHVGGPPCFWDVYQGELVAATVLQRLTERSDASIVLQKGYFRTSIHSYRRTLDHFLFQNAEFPARVCRDIRNGTAPYLEGTPSENSTPVFHIPTNAQMLRFFGLEALRVPAFAYRLLFRQDEWSIGLIREPIEAFLEPDFRPQVQWYQLPGKGRYAVDPFGLEVDGNIHILYEDFQRGSKKAVIATFRADQAGPLSIPEAVIELPGQASYPYLLVERDQIFCIPETMWAREVGLYRAIQFPRRWEKVITILKNVAAVDSTLFRHEGRWWLMCTEGDAGWNNHLYVWHAPELEGPWESHAANPVKIDVRSARPAGTPFVHGGTLYRPSQDCSRTYGGRIVLNRVTKLTTTEFEEEPTTAIEPFSGSPFPDGIHTLSSVGDFTLVDGKRQRFIWRAIRRPSADQSQ